MESLYGLIARGEGEYLEHGEEEETRQGECGVLIIGDLELYDIDGTILLVS